MAYLTTSHKSTVIYIFLRLILHKLTYSEISLRYNNKFNLKRRESKMVIHRLAARF